MNSKYPSSFAVFLFFGCVFFLILKPVFSIGQDKMYLENEVRNGKIIEITSDKIKYKKPENPGPDYTIDRSMVKLLFNESGGFLIIQKLDSVDKKQGDRMIQNFINPYKQDAAALDRIFTLQSKIINCLIVSSDENQYLINNNDIGDLPYPKSSVAVIIYKDGKHSIVSSLPLAIEALNNLKEEKNTKTAKVEVKQKKEQQTTSNKITPPSKDQKTEAATPEPDDLARQEQKQILKEEKRIQAEQKKQMDDSITATNASNKKYKKSLADAYRFYEDGDIENAKLTYGMAISLRPEGYESKNTPDSLEENLLKYFTYDSLLTSANTLFTVDLYASLAAYKKVLEIKPADYVSLKQINYLEKEISKKEEEERIKEEIRKKKEMEVNFQAAVKKGDSYKLSNYEEALTAYSQALQIHPEDEYVKRMVEIMTYRLNLQKKEAGENKTNP